jgi:hypothetical protein
MQQNQNDTPDSGNSLFQMNLDAQNSYLLRSSASWSKVLGIVGIIFGILFCILCALALIELDSYSGNSFRYQKSGINNLFGDSSSAETEVGLWLFIIAGVIFILGGLFSLNFGNKITIALKVNDQQGLNKGFAALRNYFALRSITLILVLIIILLAIAGSV